MQSVRFLMTSNLKLWPALAVSLVLLVTPLRAQFVYVANISSNNVLGYAINSTTGALTAVAGSPFAAGSEPFSVAANGKFVYVANGNDNNVSGYTINSTTGALTPIANAPFPAEVTPVFVAVDPSGKFAYVANASSNNVPPGRSQPSPAHPSAQGYYRNPWRWTPASSSPMWRCLLQ